MTKTALHTTRNDSDQEPVVAPRDATIVRRAARAFRERSYHGASMQQIAAAAGVQKSTLYHHFASKDDILLRILEEAVEILLRPLEEIAARGDLDPAEKLRLAVTNHVRALCEHADLLAVLLFETRTFSRKIERQIKPQRDRYNALLLEIIKDGAAQGRFRNIDPRIALYGIFGMCNWVCQWYRVKGPIPPAELAREYADLALASLEPKGK